MYTYMERERERETVGERERLICLDSGEGVVLQTEMMRKKHTTCFISSMLSKANGYRKAQSETVQGLRREDKRGIY